MVVGHKYFRRGCFASARPLHQGATASLCPTLSYATAAIAKFPSLGIVASHTIWPSMHASSEILCINRRLVWFMPADKINNHFRSFYSFTARRYASAVYAVVVCLSVRPSVCLSVCHKPALYQSG